MLFRMFQRKRLTISWMAGFHHKSGNEVPYPPPKPLSEDLHVPNPPPQISLACSWNRIGEFDDCQV
jgi:hypothetical protein